MKMEGEKLIKTTEQIIITDFKEESDRIILQMNEIDESFIQEQIKQEPVDIRNEPIVSDNEEIEFGEKTTPYDEEKDKSNRAEEQKLSKILQKAVDTIPNKCYLCDIIFQSQQNFDDHFESHRSMLPYKCSQCSTDANPIILSTMIALNKHFERHNFDYICTDCPLRFRTFRLLMYHLKNIHQKPRETSEKVPINIGNESFQSEDHETDNDDTMTQRFNCNSCEKHFSTRHQLQQHQACHKSQHPASTCKRKHSDSVTQSLPNDTEEAIERDETTNKSNDDTSYATETEESSMSGSEIAQKTESKALKNIPNKCYICNTIHQTEMDFDDHLEGHKTMLPYNCSECSTPFETSSVTTLNNHFQKHDYNYVCPHCPLRYRTFVAFMHHNRQTHREPTNEYTCGFCEKIFTTLKAYRSHVNTHESTVKEQFKNQVNTDKSVVKERFKYQVNSTHKSAVKERYKCEPCQRVFVSNRVLQKHCTSYVCVGNREKFRQEIAAEEKSRCQSEIDNILEKNEIDGSNDLDGGNVRNSINHNETAASVQMDLERIDIIDEPLQSDDYGTDGDETIRSYGSENNELSLSGKRRIHDRPEEEQPIANKCYVCGTILESEDELKIHLQCHKQMLPYTCTQCNTKTTRFEAATLIALNEHFEKHDFSYVCPHCPLRYRTCNAFALHIRETHDEQTTAYPCGFCGKVFGSILSYQRHVYAHKNVVEGRFRCEPCQRIFATNRILRKHNKSYFCVRNTEKFRRRTATEDISEYQSMETKEKNNGDAEKQVAIDNPSENDNILEKNEILLSVVKLETNDTEGAQVENSINQNITGGSIQKHIELEPIDIKDEPFQSDIEEMPEDETTRSYESENIMPKPPRKRRKRNLPEEEQPNPNKCHFCDIDFESKSELHSHLECHKEMLPYECKRCSTEANPIIFTTVVLLNKHLETHGFRFVCQQCPLRFRTNMQVRYHMADAHNEHKFEYDGKVFSNIYAYQRYIRDYRNLVMQKFKCESCHKRFKNTTLLKRHLAFHRRQELAAAGKAAKKRKVEIDDHPKVVKTIPNKCYVCDTFLENESAFDNHLESHKNMLPFECSRCSTETNPIRLVTVSALNEHFESHGFYYSCSLCPLRFRTNSLLIHHKYNHKKKRLGTENSKSKTANSIKTEKNVETAGRPKRKRGPRIDPKMVKRIPNKCYICDTVHESESDFHHHLESHNIMLPFECSRCSTEKHSIKLSTVISLNKHIERHDFFYACPHCPSRFRTNNTLIHHKYTHGRKRSKTENASTSTIKQSYKCEPCQKHFWSIHMFERHKTSILCKHNIELARLGMITTEISNSTPLQTEEESDAKDTNPIVASNSPENDNILVENEIDSRNNLSSTVKLEPEDFDEKKADIAVYIQDQIQVEPIDIKDEPFDSNSAPFDDDEATHILENESNKPELTKKQVNSKPPTVMETIENKCYICETILGSKNEFTNHLESHKEMLPYKCLQCSTETNLLICKNTYLLNKHFESHGFSYECRQCPLRFRTSTTRSRHKERAHDEHNLEHSCEICGKVFNNISTFRNHLFAHRNLMMQRYKCRTCEKYFPTSYGLRQHAKTHIETVGNTAQKPHPEMEQTENDKNDTPNTVKRKRSKKLVEVQVEAEVVKKENPHKCNVCGTELANSSELNKHLECHSNMLPFECPQCSTQAAPIKLLTVIALHRHFKRHSYDYVCPYCPLKYLSQRVLARHVHDKHDKSFIRKRKNSRPEVEVTVEKKEDPNKCNVCGTEVANSKDLKVHLKCHEDMLPYECPQCSTEANPMKILGVIGLHKHFKRHSYDYVCPYCPLKYLSKRILSHHIRTKHDKTFAFNRKPSSVPDSTTIEMSKSQLLLNEEKSTDETTSGSAEQTFSTNLHMNSGNMPNEIGGSNNPSSILVLNPTVDVIKTEIVDL